MAVWGEVKLADLEGAMRLDAEYYQPAYLDYAKQAASGDKLGDLLEFIMHPVELTRLYADKGLQILLAQNIRDNRLDFSVTAFMPKEVQPILSRNRLLPGDVVVTRSGANFGDSAYYHGEPEVIYACADCLVLRPNNIPGGYLSTYLSSSIGHALLTRGQYGAAQPHIAPTHIKAMRVPRLGKLESKVHELIVEAYSKERESRRSYNGAERLLLQELGLSSLPDSTSVFFERRFSQTEKARRLDAEFFQPKYYQLINLLRKRGQTVRLGDHLREPATRGMQPIYVEGGEVIVINSQHVRGDCIKLTENRTTSSEYVAKKKDRGRVRKHDVLLNSTGVITIGRAQTLLQEVNAVVDSHITILRPKDELDPVYLGLFLNSLSGFLQTERGWTGSSGQIELRLEVINEYEVWLAPQSIQLQLRKLIEDAHVARCECYRILREAKKIVEAAIFRKESWNACSS